MNLKRKLKKDFFWGFAKNIGEDGLVLQEEFADFCSPAPLVGLDGGDGMEKETFLKE